jgi:N-succinyldiaminopimelate aminotransferase
MVEHTSSIFAEMSALAGRTNSINLGQGFPDTDGPDSMKEVARNAITEGLGSQYPPPYGIPELRAAIAEHQQRFYGLQIDPDTGVVVTTGASEALVAALMAFVDEGDEVVMFEPRFDLYAAAISLARGQRVGVPMTEPDLRPDIDALRAAITPRTRVLLINSPHNPTGIVFTRDELDQIAAIAIESDLIVISDEAYEHMWFNGSQHIPISTLPGMFERTVTVGSGGKMFSFTGWKVGWATGPEELIAAIRVIRQHLTYVSGGPLQYAMAHGLRLSDDYFTNYRRNMEQQCALLSDGLREIGFGVIPSQGSYYVTTDITPLGYTDGLEFCRELPSLAGVVAIPHQVFCDSPGASVKHVRWAFCKQPSVLSQALKRLSAGLRT